MREQAEPGYWLRRSAARTPAQAALHLEAQTLTFADLLQRAKTRANAMLQAPKQPQLCLVNSRHRAEACLHIWAGLYANMAILPLRPDTPNSAAITALLESAATDGPIEPMTLGRRADLPPDTRLILATSGSSGQPKAVLLSASGLHAAVQAANQRLTLGRGDTWLHCLPLEHIGGLAILLRCGQAGAACRLLPDHDPQRIADALGRYPVSHLSLTPSMLHALLQCWRGSPPPGLQRVLIGGAMLNAELEACARRLGWPLCVSYGMTETASQIATRCTPGPAGCVGRVLPGLQLRIDPNSGEILVRGATLMRGYLRPGGPPDSAMQGGWFHTGDIGHLDEQHRLHVQGRLDDLLNNAGLRLHPAEVEAKLTRIQGVEQALLSARPDPLRGDLLVAVYTGEASPEQVLADCQNLLPGSHRPRECLRLERLPWLASGKPDRRAVRSLLRNRSEHALDGSCHPAGSGPQ